MTDRYTYRPRSLRGRMPVPENRLADKKEPYYRNRHMRTFTIKYTDRGRDATVTVQGNEVATMDDLLCVRHDGMPIATFPKEDVQHVRSRGDDDDDWPAPADDELESAPWRPAAANPAWTPVSQRAPLRRPLQQASGGRVSRRVVSETRPPVSR